MSDECQPQKVPLSPPTLAANIAPASSLAVHSSSRMNYGSLPSRFLQAIDERPSPRAQLVRRSEGWEPISSQELLRRVAGLAHALIELGVKPGDRVGLFAPNCPEWHTADFAIMGSGAVTVPIYFNESADRTAYILNHSGAQVLFISGEVQLGKFLQVRGELKDLQQVIVAEVADTLPSEYLRYETLIATAGGPEIASYRARARFIPASLLPSSTPPAPPASPRASCSRTRISAPTSPIRAVNSSSSRARIWRFPFSRWPTFTSACSTTCSFSAAARWPTFR